MNSQEFEEKENSPVLNSKKPQKATLVQKSRSNELRTNVRVLSSEDETGRFDLRQVKSLSQEKVPSVNLNLNRKPRNEFHATESRGTSGNQCYYHVENLVSILQSEGTVGETLENQDSINLESSKTLEKPEFIGIYGQSGFCMILGRQVQLLNPQLTKHHATVSFDCEIQKACFSVDGSFLVLGDSLGCVHFLDVESHNVVFSQALPGVFREELSSAKLEFSGLKFASISDEDGLEELMISLICHERSENSHSSKSLQKLLRFSNLDFSGLKQAIRNSDRQLAMDIKSQIQMEQIDLMNGGLENCSDIDWFIESHGPGKGRSICWVLAGGIQPAGSWAISKWKTTEAGHTELFDQVSQEWATPNCYIRKIHILSAESCSIPMMITLDSDGYLSLWDYKRMIILRKWSRIRLHDFSIVPTGKYDYKAGELLMMGLTADNSDTVTDENGSDSRDLLLIRLPNFEIENVIQVAKESFLTFGMQQTKSETSSIFFLEKKSVNNETTAETKIEYCARALVETKPSKRYERLVKKNMFDQAQSLAIQWGLDMEPLRKAKLEYLVERDSKNGSIVDLEGQIMDILAKIEDDAFVIDFCLSIPVSSVKQLSFLLRFCQKRLQKEQCQASEYQANFFYSSMKRLGTYKLVMLDEVDAGFDFESWKEFLYCNLQEEMQKVLSKGLVHCAIIIWRRHYLEQSLSDQIVPILQSIPDHLHCSFYKDWLEYELMPVIDNAVVRTKTYQWIIERAIITEDQFNSPESALELLEIIFGEKSNPLHPSVASSTLSLVPATPGQFVRHVKSLAPQTAYQYFGGIRAEAENLKKQLQDIIYLKQHHQFDISLLEYCQNTPSSISLALLDRVSAHELFEQHIMEHFLPYTKTHGLDMENLLLEYAQELLSETEASQSMNNWEPRICTIFNQISKCDKKIDLLIDVLKHCSIPWTENIDQMIQTCREMEGGWRAHELKDQIRFIEIRKMLIDYGIEYFSISDSEESKSIIRHITCRVDQENSLNDALQFADAQPYIKLQDIFALRLRMATKHGKINLIEQAFELAPNDILLSLAPEYLVWCEFELDNIMCGDDTAQIGDVISEDEKRTKYRNLNHGAEITCKVSMEKLISPDPIFKDSLTIFRVARYLVQEYGIMAKLESLKSETGRLEILRNYSIDYISKSGVGNPIDLLQQHDVKIFRLSEILGVATFKLHRLLAEASISVGDFEHGLFLCKEMLVKFPGSEASASIISILKKIVDYAHSYSNIFGEAEQKLLTANLKKMLSQAISMECPNSIPDSLDCFKNTDLLDKIFCHSSSGEYQTKISSFVTKSDLSASQDELGKCIDRLYDNYFKENPLVLNTDEAMGLGVAFAKQTLPKSEQPKKSAKSVSKAALQSTPLKFDILSYLETNRAYQTCLSAFSRYREFSLRYKENDHLICEDSQMAFEILETMFHKILANPSIDCLLAFACTISLPQKSAFEGLKVGLSMVNNEFHRLSQITKIGIGAATLWQQRSFAAQLETLARNANWWKQFKLLDIEFSEEKFRLDDDYVAEFISPLLRKTKLDIVTAVNFCADYNLPEDMALLKFIEILLIEDVSKDEYKNMIVGVIDEVDNKQKLLDLLKEIQQRISPYDYERIRFIFELISRFEKEDPIAKKGCLILDILENYERRKQPSQEEMESVSSRTGFKFDYSQETLFSNSDKRLPYHELILEPWAVLNEELNEETISLLIPLAVPLKLFSDNFYVLVIRNQLKKLAADSSFQVKFADIKPLVLKIRDMKSVISLCVHAAEIFPVGLDRVHAYKTAAFAGDKWLKQAFESEEEKSVARSSIQSLKHTLIKAELENILQENNLMEYKEYLDRPSEMLRKLYEEVPLQSSKAEVSLHSVCENIGAKANVDIWKLRRALFEEWIKTPLAGQSQDSLLPSYRLQRSTLRGKNPEDILNKRIIYLMNIYSSHESAKLLLKVAYEPSQKIGTISRIRALNILFQLANEESINEVHNSKEARKYLHVLYYLADCEELRISVRARELFNIEKDSFARSLWLNRGKEPKIVQFICNILLDYEIYDDLKLWEAVLDKMVQSRIYLPLLGILETISSISGMENIKNLEHVWNQTISQTLDSLKENHDSLLMSNLVRLVEKCPGLVELDQEKMLSGFVNLSQYPDLQLDSILCLATLYRYFDANDSFEKAIISILSKLQKDEMAKTVKAVYAKSGQFFEDRISPKTVIKHFCYNMINQKKWFAILVHDSSILIDLVAYHIRIDKIENLLDFSLGYNKVDEAHELLKKYYTVWNGKAPKEDCDLIEFYRTSNS